MSMRAEVLPGDEHTLTVALDVDALGVIPGDDTSAKLTETAGDWAAVVLKATGAAPEPGPPRTVDAVTIRLTRTIVVAEATVPLAEPAEVWA